MEATHFEGNDGTEFSVGRGEVFVWERDATKRMLGNPKKTSGNDVDLSSFSELGDGAVEANKIDPDADLYNDSDFLAVSGHLDRDVLEDVASEAELLNGMYVDPVADVVRGLNEKIGINPFLDVVDNADAIGDVNDISDGGRWLDKHDAEHEPTVVVSRAAFDIALAVARKIVGVGRDGRVKGRSGHVSKENMDGAAASM